MLDGASHRRTRENFNLITTNNVPHDRSSAQIIKTGEVGSSSDILILGAGLAGLFLALSLKPRPCTIVSLGTLGKASSSAWAQGGIAAALHADDSPETHAQDTISSGGDLVDPAVAKLVTTQGPQRLRDLIKLGVPFDRSADGTLSLSLEAAHSYPRVARVSGDRAGAAIMDALVLATLSADHITVIEGAKSVALLQDSNGHIGGAVLESKDGLVGHAARETILSMGGTGGLYNVTTNPAVSRGDGLAMAYSAGALIADPEFVQFHPTAIDIGVDPAPLATEVLRGEGARLVDRQGHPFMENYHTAKELAPRSVVARAVHTEIVEDRGAFLDCREAVGEEFPDKFPTVFASCKSAGIDPRTAPIPVAPAAHYHMGGIVTDTWGKTSLNGLSACGECASTGIHGANRLASNSLLEAVVFAHRIAKRLIDSELNTPKSSEGLVLSNLPRSSLASLRQRMSTDCAVVRDATGLNTLLGFVEKQTNNHGESLTTITARLIAEAALSRRESRGGHFRTDFPDQISPNRTYIYRGRKLDEKPNSAGSLS